MSADWIRTRRVWECKIGGRGLALPPGADAPLRSAVERAYRALTGVDPEFNFSGWGGKLDPGEASVVDNTPYPTPLPKFRSIHVSGALIVGLDEGGGAWLWNGALQAWRQMDSVVQRA